MSNQINPATIQLTKETILSSLNNQQATKNLQTILMEAKNETIVSLVKELRGEYRKLILDKNGNYLCTDLFKICQQKERIDILKELSPTLSDDCVDGYATFPIQTLIEYSSCEDEYKLILNSLNDYNKLLAAAINPNGGHVIQKIIIRIPERFRKEFNSIFISSLDFLSKQKYGIVSVKCFVSKTKDKETIKSILNFIKNNFMSLAVDRFGNYLIQYLLEKWNNFEEGTEIENLVFQNLKDMIQSKYSSFICELLVGLISNEEKNALVESFNLDEVQYMYNNNYFANKILRLLGINNMPNYNNNINNNIMNQIQLYNQNNQDLQNHNYYCYNNNIGYKSELEYNPTNNKKEEK